MPDLSAGGAGNFSLFFKKKHNLLTLNIYFLYPGLRIVDNGYVWGQLSLKKMTAYRICLSKTGFVSSSSNWKIVL